MQVVLIPLELYIPGMQIHDQGSVPMDIIIIIIIIIIYICTHAQVKSTINPKINPHESMPIISHNNYGLNPPRTYPNHD